MDGRGARSRLAARTTRRRPVSDRRRQEGAALIEFALIAPVLFLVLFGVIEFGIALNDFQSIRHGVRDGARQAVVQQYGAEDGSCANATTPADTPTRVKQIICITEDRIGLGSDVRVRVVYTKASGSGGDHGSVDVCAQRNVNPFTGAIPAIDGISLTSSIEMRLEAALAPGIFALEDPAGTKKTYAEALAPGQDWSRC